MRHFSLLSRVSCELSKHLVKHSPLVPKVHYDLFRSPRGEVERLRRNERQILLAPVLSVENINLPIRNRQDCRYGAGCISAVRTLEIEMCLLWLTRYVVLFPARNLKRILKY